MKPVEPSSQEHVHFTDIEPPPQKHTYFTEVENPVEMARLMYQDRLFTEQMGGVLREYTPRESSRLRHVLDVACGPGGWVIDLAFQNQKTQVVGIDISQQMLAFAESQAVSQGLENATFRHMDILKPLLFDDNTFDLVNARFLFGFMPRDAWLPLVRECLRILRPGGTLRLTEMGESSSSSPAGEQMGRLFSQALHKAGRSFSPDGYKMGISHMLGRFLMDAGFSDVSPFATVIDSSAGTEAHWQSIENASTLYQVVKPFIVNIGLITEEAYDSLYMQALAEIRQENFSAITFLLTVTGKKPVPESAQKDA